MDENADTSREESAWSWDKFTKRLHNYSFDNTLSGHSKLVVATPPTNTVVGQGSHSHNLVSGISNESMLRYTQDVSTISTLGVEAHGIELYNKDLDDNFYNAYLSHNANQHGSGCHVTPKDIGAVLINFALNPGDL